LSYTKDVRLSTELRSFHIQSQLYFITINEYRDVCLVVLSIIQYRFAAASCSPGAAWL
jgi:hypothetical protein